jgi:hypothetical protein
MAWRRLGKRRQGWKKGQRGWEDEAATEERSCPTDSSQPVPLSVLYFSVAREPRLRMGDSSGFFVRDVFSPLSCLLDPILSIGLHLDQSLKIA